MNAPKYRGMAGGVVGGSNRGGESMNARARGTMAPPPTTKRRNGGGICGRASGGARQARGHEDEDEGEAAFALMINAQAATVLAWQMSGRVTNYVRGGRCWGECPWEVVQTDRKGVAPSCPRVMNV